MPWWITLLNSLAALTSVSFGVAALAKPTLIAPPSDKQTSSRFYPAMYASRAIPLGLAVCTAMWFSFAPTFVLFLLAIAIAAQCGDIIIGAAYRIPGMIAGAAFAVACHGSAILALM